MAERIKKQILDKEDDPDGLEDLYRSDPENFKETLLSLAEDKPGLDLFKFWRVRLEYLGRTPNPPAVPLATVLITRWVDICPVALRQRSNLRLQELINIYSSISPSQKIGYIDSPNTPTDLL